MHKFRPHHDHHSSVEKMLREKKKYTTKQTIMADCPYITEYFSDVQIDYVHCIQTGSFLFQEKVEAIAAE